MPDKEKNSMPKLPAITPKKLIALLKKAGFEIDHVTGSHYILYNPSTKKRATVPFHRKDIPKGTLHSILKSADIDRKDL